MSLRVTGLHMPGRRIVFIACSLDGFIAGPDDDLSFLEPTNEQKIENTFPPFLAGVGALLMGRRTFDVVSKFDGPWPYGDKPVLVFTHRAIESVPATVKIVSGDIEAAVSKAVSLAGELDVYIDGGQVVRQAIDAGLVDELVVTVVPHILGRGTPLFAGATRRHDLQLSGQRSLGGGFVELRYRPMPKN